MSHYLPFKEELHLGNVTCPVQPCKVSIIEKLNNLRINVFGYEGFHSTLLRERTTESSTYFISLEAMTSIIASLKICRECSEILLNMIPKTFYCYSCLHRYSNEALLKAHLPYFNEHAPQCIVMPEPGKDSAVQFKQHTFSLVLPYVIYADFEVLIELMQNVAGNTMKNAAHIPCLYHHWTE